MSVNINNMSRRSFFKLGAGAAAGAALFGLAGLSGGRTAFAEGADAKNLNLKPAALKDLPDAVRCAESSDLIHGSLNCIYSSVNKIKDSGLRAKTLDLINDTRPTFMQRYSSAADITAVYNKLADLGLAKTDSLSPEKLFPPYSGKAPQSFLTAPGSGYFSHHPYPGGLCTHVAANLSITEGIINTYKNIFGYEVNSDVALSAQALHDLAKPWVFQWNSDGSSLKEYTIAGTGAHHVLSIAEAMHRGMPAEEVTAQACAHNHPGNAKDEADVVAWIKAAAVIAGENPIKYGVLDKTGDNIPAPHHQEGYIVHLGDHDWVLSSDASAKSIAALKKAALKDYGFSSADLENKPFNLFRNYIGSQISFTYIHNCIAQNGEDYLRGLIRRLILK